MSTPSTKKVACIGAGYVGGPTMAVMAKNNPDREFYVLDLNADRINSWNSDNLPIFEPGLKDLVEGIRGKNLFFSTDVEKYIEECDIIFVAVNTPTKTYGIGKGMACDLANWELAARSIARHATRDKIIVEKSTVPVRTAAGLGVVFSTNSDVRFCVLSNPEFLAEGSAIKDLSEPDRILIGSPETDNAYDAEFSEYSLNAVSSLYEAWVPKERIVTTNLWSSELAKLVANAFLAQRISSINSISALCEKTGADVTEISRVIGMDTRIGNKFLSSSLGFGGSCFKKDISSLVYIAQTSGLPEVAAYWEQVLLLNDYQKRRCTEQLIAGMFQSVREKFVTVLGFAFKKNTADVRESPAVDVFRMLLGEGAIVKLYDPKVKREDAIREMEYQGGFDNVDWDKRFISCESPQEACQQSHGIIVCTEWDEFATLDYQELFDVMFKPAYFFDGRNIVDLQKVHEIGFEVGSIGRGELRRAKFDTQTGVSTPIYPRRESSCTIGFPQMTTKRSE